MSSAVALDSQFLVEGFELNHEREKEQKELGTIIASLKGLDKTFSKIEKFSLHGSKSSKHPKDLMSELEAALGEMQKSISNLETQMIKSQNQQSTNQYNIGEKVVENLQKDSARD